MTTPALKAIADGRLGPGLEVLLRVTWPGATELVWLQFDFDAPETGKLGEVMKSKDGGVRAANVAKRPLTGLFLQVRLDAKTLGGAANKVLDELGSKVTP